MPPAGKLAEPNFRGTHRPALRSALNLLAANLVALKPAVSKPNGPNPALNPAVPKLALKPPALILPPTPRSLLPDRPASQVYLQ